MNTITLNIIFFIVVYLLVFIFCYFFAGKLRSKSKDKDKKKRKNKTTFKMMNEGTFLIKRYNFNAIFEIYGRYLNKKWGKKHE